MIVFSGITNKITQIMGEKCTGGGGCAKTDNVIGYCVGIWWEKWKSLSRLEKQQNKDVLRS
jgi:hypothetical protein